VADTSGLPDLAARSLGGSVVWANDEFFAGRENLITPEPAGFSPRTFSAKGQVYDGWETRRRRDPSGRAPTDAYDEAIVRLGAPGVVRSVVVDTAHFTGNFPPDASVEATWLDGHPSVEELQAASWTSLVPRSRIEGDSENEFTVSSPQRWSHVRLRIYPDGGVARLRVRGEVVADPRLVEALGTVDLAALELGGRVTGCSNEHYGRPDRLISPGLAGSMGEGWETARRRDSGHDWVQVRLACEGVVRVVELDTSWFLGNAPGSAAVSSVGASAADAPVVLPSTPLQPDTRHRFVLPVPVPASEVRLDVFPDGGMARLRLWGSPTDAGLAAMHDRWASTG
jgi:allantoicase